MTYRHVHLRDYRDVAKHYWALDLYVIASRDEGGPMAVLESMASGVPLVSTKVGMSIDIIANGSNGFLNEVEDADGLAANAALLVANRDLRTSVSSNAAVTAKAYDWRVIAARYHREVYRPLLVERGFRFGD